MRNLFLFLCLMLVSGLALGQTTDAEAAATAAAKARQANTTIAQMTDAERIELLEKANNSNAAAAKEWIEVGKGLGSGLAATAKEMGVAVNDFAKSPVGKLAVVLLVWTVAGESIAHILIAGSMLFIFVPVWFAVGRRMFGQYVVTKDAKGNEKLTFRNMSFHDSEGSAFFWWLSGIAIFTAFIVSLATV